MKIEHMFELIMNDDIETDDEIFAVADGFGEDYGAIISYILGFDKRFVKGVHKHKSLMSSFNFF